MKETIQEEEKKEFLDLYIDENDKNRELSSSSSSSPNIPFVTIPSDGDIFFRLDQELVKENLRSDLKKNSKNASDKKKEKELKNNESKTENDLFIRKKITRRSSTTLIDKDTQEKDYKRERKDIKKAISMEKKILSLVFSDEFEVEGRGFSGSEDPFFQAIRKPDTSNEAIQFYESSRDYVTTKGGSLIIRTDPKKRAWIEKKSKKEKMDEDDDMADDDQYKHAIKWGNQLIEEAIEDIQNMKYLEEKKSKRKTKENKKTKRYDEAVENAKKLIKELEKKSYEEIDQDLLKRNGFEIYTKNYTSGMVQSWNRFCFTGGLLEIDLKLPGKAREGGLWPAVWLMGNLARATYDKSTTHVWPWSYSECVPGSNIHTKQEINACMSSPGYGLNPFQGRGAPEIDLLEVMPGPSPFVSSSLQISPGISGPGRPINNKKLNSSQIWYEHLYLGPQTHLNEGFWGQEAGPVEDKTPDRIYKYLEDAISANTRLSDTHFEKFHRYSLDWEPGPDGFLRWYIDDELIFGIEGSDVYNLTHAKIPEEPMYLILNTAISHRWGMEPCPASCPACYRCYDCLNPDCQCSLPAGLKDCKNLPAELQIGSIRLYQDLGEEVIIEERGEKKKIRINSRHSLSCSPPSHPTLEFIRGHAERYEEWKPYKEISIGPKDIEEEIHDISNDPLYKHRHNISRVRTFLYVIVAIVGLSYAIYMLIIKLINWIRRRDYHQISSQEHH